MRGRCIGKPFRDVQTEYKRSTKHLEMHCRGEGNPIQEGVWENVNEEVPELPRPLRSGRGN